MGRTGIYACGESVRRRNSLESVALFSLKQEAPASIGGSTFTVNGNAAMHSEKLGNAIRTIDTWYPGYEEDYMGPININTFGTVVPQGKAYRPISEKKDFYTLFDKLVEDGDLPDEDDKHYVMAVLVLGGVFGSSSKEE